MKSCLWCGVPDGPTWDHRADCPHWPGSEWARRHGYFGDDCAGLVWCVKTHPYDPVPLCGCEGQCHYCSHVGCERCLEKAWTGAPWWRRIWLIWRGKDWRNWNHLGQR